MNTLQHSHAVGKAHADDVLSLITVGSSGRVAVEFAAIHATIGLPVGGLGIFATVEPGDLLPGQIARVHFDDAGVPRTVLGIVQPLDKPSSKHAVELVVSLPRPVRRRVPLAQVTRVEALDEVVSRDTGAGVQWA